MGHRIVFIHLEQEFPSSSEHELQVTWWCSVIHYQNAEMIESEAGDCAKSEPKS